MKNIYEQKELVTIILPSQYIIIFNSNNWMYCYARPCILLQLPNAERNMKIGVPVVRRRESQMSVNKFGSSCRPWRTCSVLSCILIAIKTLVFSYSVLCSFAPRASHSWVCECVLFLKTGILLPGVTVYMYIILLR